jgi:YbbR domain-containing protein
VRRAASFLIRNWPLKLGAILLATVLYSGLVLGQNVRTFSGEVPVEAIRQPLTATLLEDPAPVTTIRYRAPLDVGVLSPNSFRATVNLAEVEPNSDGRPTRVPITLVATDADIQIVDFQPRELELTLDPISERELPVKVLHGTMPEGVNVGLPQISPSAVTVRGASSRVETVAEVIARVPIDATALNVDRDVELVAVDANGNQVSGIELDPERARVRVAVARQLATKSLPVVPQLIGEPAPGYRVADVVVEPLVITISGEEATVSRLQAATTDPIDVSGRTTDLEAVVGYNLPADVSVTGEDQVRVSLTIVEEQAEATLLVGVGVTGTPCACTYAYDTTAVRVTVAGPAAELETLDAASLRATADVSGLSPGSHSVALAVAPSGNLQVVSIVPARLTVTITATPSASPSL